MSAQVKFSPAPGWPTPTAGWTPPAGWEVPADWPPAPTGWAFYRGPYGEPAPAPPGYWEPTAAPSAAAVAPAASTTPPTAAATPARSQIPLLIGVGVAVVVVIAAAIFAIPRLFPGSKSDLTQAQFEQLSTKKSVGALPVQLTEVTTLGDIDSSMVNSPACVKSHEFDVAHHVTIKTSRQPTNMSLALLDSAENLATAYNLGTACNQETQTTTPPAREGTVGTAVWRFWEAPGARTEGGVTPTGPASLRVYYRNVYVAVFIPAGEAFDEQGFARAFISDVDSVS